MIAKESARSVGTLPMVAALLAGCWLLSSRFLRGYLVDSLPELGYAAFLFLALPAFLWSVLWSVVHLVRARPDGHRGVAAAPLAINFLAVVLYVVPAPFVEQMDFQRHHATRTEVVRGIESGDLWRGGVMAGERGSPGIALLDLPRSEYPPSVTGGSSRTVTVFKEDGVLHVVFHPATGNLLDASSALLYRADGRPPSLSNPHLYRAASSDALGDGWHRIRFAREEVEYAALLMIVLYLTAGSSVVVIPLALGVRYAREWMRQRRTGLSMEEKP